MNGQFRILYREFLFRLVDLELLSADARGDADRLIGQIGALLTLFSIFLGLTGLMFDGSSLTAPNFENITWPVEHFLIASTMLIVGLFAVLSWDSTFPDRRDILVLIPLPIPTHVLFLAKVAAVATGLGITVTILNAGPGLSWPWALYHGNGTFQSNFLFVAGRSFPAYWITMFAAGTFLYCCVLAVQGLTALLPRALFLRLSAFLQVAAFCLFLSVYCLQPTLATPAALNAPENQRILEFLPSYWFLGLFQQLSGSITPASARLAHYAWIGLTSAASATVAAYLLSYLHTVRMIIEQPDIVPADWASRWSPRLGSQMQTAIVLFSWRTLVRSRSHRVILSFYLGIGFAILIALSKSPLMRRQLTMPVNAPQMVSSIVMMCFWIVGTRIIFTIPVDLRANWIFRITPICAGAESVTAVRRALYLLALGPAWTASAVCFVWIWPWRAAAQHLLVLGLLGLVLIEVSLWGFRKIPFTCSWLPGKSNTHIAFWGFFAILQVLILRGGEFERRALQDTAKYTEMVAILSLVSVAARWQTARSSDPADTLVQFEDTQATDVLALGLMRDGVLPLPREL